MAVGSRARVKHVTFATPDARAFTPRNARTGSAVSKPKAYRVTRLGYHDTKQDIRQQKTDITTRRDGGSWTAWGL